MTGDDEKEATEAVKETFEQFKAELARQHEEAKKEDKK